MNKIKEIDITKEPVIEEMIKMENELGLVFDREEMNDILNSLFNKGYKKAVESFEKMIDEKKWEKNENEITNQTATKMVEYSGGVNSVIDRHNESLEELKQKLNKQK